MQVHLLLRKVDLGDSVEGAFHDPEQAYAACERANNLFRQKMIEMLCNLPRYTLETATAYVGSISDEFHVESIEVV